MQNLTSQRCFNHGAREAVARCPECGRFFCRECVTEHEDRAICASCLKRLVRGPTLKRRSFVAALHLAQCALSLLAAWFFFYLIGESLLSLPDSFHEGTLWKVRWLDSE